MSRGRGVVQDSRVAPYTELAVLLVECQVTCKRTWTRLLIQFVGVWRTVHVVSCSWIHGVSAVGQCRF